MKIDWSPLAKAPRLLFEVPLTPVQGVRFQPTGFPDLGAAAYEAPNFDGIATQMLLVESAQSMANRLEAVCWDEANHALADVITGMPYVSVSLWNGNTTNSLLEANRLNSPYIMRGDGFKEQFRKEANLPAREKEVWVFDRALLARTVFRYDPCSVLHGIFLEKLDGRARLQRCLSGFIEAHDVSVADSGGVKNDRVAPTPKVLNAVGLKKASAAEGYGNVPFHRTEYTAKGITAYFSLDLAQIRAYGLGERGEEFLMALALWKVWKFLDTGLRLRTACDLDLAGNIEVTRPKDSFAVPSLEELEEALPSLVEACTDDGLFADPAVTRLEFSSTD